MRLASVAMPSWGRWLASPVRITPMPGSSRRTSSFYPRTQTAALPAGRSAVAPSHATGPWPTGSRPTAPFVRNAPRATPSTSESILPLPRRRGGWVIESWCLHAPSSGRCRRRVRLPPLASGLEGTEPKRAYRAVRKAALGVGRQILAEALKRASFPRSGRLHLVVRTTAFASGEPTGIALALMQDLQIQNPVVRRIIRRYRRRSSSSSSQ